MFFTTKTASYQNN